MTKSNIVNDAFGELGLSSYVFTLQPEDLNLALTRLEALVAELDVAGIELNWSYAADVSSVSGNVEVDIPPYAYSGIVAQLAINLASSFGKVPSPTTLISAKKGYEAMLAVSALPYPIASNRYVPLGSGNKGWRSRRVFMPRDTAHRINASNDGIGANTEAKSE